MSRSFTVKSKVEKGGKILGIICHFNDNVIQLVHKEDFKRLFSEAQATNAKLSEDCKIISKGADIKTVDLSGKQLLYHGSKGGISGKIRPTSRYNCDFGSGFYTGTLLNQAQGILKNNNNGVSYKMYCDTVGLNIYKFSDPLTWALYVGVNRGFIILSDIPKFKATFNSINSSDIIVGEIADDRMSQVFPMFMNNIITDQALIACLKAIKLGNQWVFKTNKACDSIIITNANAITPSQLDIINKRHNEMMSGIDNKISNIRMKYRRTGKFLDEILEEYK